MSITYILVLTVLALLAGWIFPRQKLVPALLVISLLALFWLQPSTPIRHLDFWLPAISITLTVLVWAISASVERRSLRHILPATLAILFIPLLIAASRYFGPLCCLTPSPPPQILPVLAACIAIAGLFLAVYLLPRSQCMLHWLGILVLFAIFIILKSEPLALAGQRLAARHYRTANRACGCRRPALAGLFIPGVPPSARAARFSS